MGIIKLQVQNNALLLKWCWKLATQQDCMWSKTMQLIYGTVQIQSIPLTRSSYFIKSLSKLQPFFHISYINTDEGGLWKWTTNGQFTMSSAYEMLHQSGIISQYHKHLLRMKAPTKVRVFFWLLLHDALLTQHRLLRRGCNIQSGCHLCGRRGADY
jgi:zinc-binding in reverse transcriptase